MKTKQAGTESRTAAVLTIKDAPGMKAEGRAEIAAWLRRQAEYLEREGKEYSERYTARYFFK